MEMLAAWMVIPFLPIPAESGNVRVGGQDVSGTELASLRGAMGQVPQVGAILSWLGPHWKVECCSAG